MSEHRTLAPEDLCKEARHIADQLSTGRLDDVVYIRPAVEVLRAAAQLIETLTNVPHLERWVMHDNHTFTRLPSDDEAAHALVMKCFDEDRGYISLCGTWSDEGTNQARRRPKMLLAGAVGARTDFEQAAKYWLHANPGA